MTVITDIDTYRLVAMRSALGLEVLGMKTRGGSVYALVKREFGFKGNKQKVFDLFNEYVDEHKRKEGYLDEKDI